MKKMHALTAGATIVLAMGGVSGCGSSSEDDDGPTAGSAIETVSKEEFVPKVNALCEANGEAIGSKFMAVSQPPKPAELEDAYENMLKESYKIVGDVLAVGAPEGQEQQLIELLVETQRVTKMVEEQGREAFFAEQGSDPWADIADRLVDDFGLAACGHAE